MRLAIIRQRYTPQGGAERFLEGALEALLERNVAITLYAREWPQTKLQLIEPHIIDPPYVGALWRDWGFARAVGRAIGTSRMNLVQAHERVLTCDVYRPGDGVHATWLEERLRDASPLLRARVALSPWHRYTLAMERKLFASPWLRAVLCNSKLVRDDIMARFGLPAERLPVIYNAVDANVYSPALRAQRGMLRERLRIPEEAVLFLLVGSGFRRKGVPAALAALARLPVPAHLLVVGDDRRLETFKTLAHEHGVRERVTFAGLQADVAPFYGAADAFVLPAIYDSFPDAAMEALAAGLPVVTSTMSGAAELVTEHDAGFVCAARDTAALAGHLERLLDPGTRAGLSERARAAVLPLTPAAMTLKLVLIYKELLEASVARRGAARGGAAASATPPPVATPAAAAPVEAPPLHGEDGLGSETIPSGPTPPRPDLPPR
jgi:UDP-glucose:(heptosyl)LPS alpha-1,3-glucosyltransferase